MHLSLMTTTQFIIHTFLAVYVNPHVSIKLQNAGNSDEYTYLLLACATSLQDLMWCVWCNMSIGVLQTFWKLKYQVFWDVMLYQWVGECRYLGTAHILEEVLIKNYKTYDMGNSITCTAAQNTCNGMYPTDLVCFMCIIVNTLYRGD